MPWCWRGWRSNGRCRWCRTTRGTSRMSANHPMFQGSTPGPLLKDADLVIVFESDVPWLPSKEQPPADARIVQIGEDPLYARYPMRGFPSDLTITATALSVLEALEQALAGRTGRMWTSGARGWSQRSAKLHDGVARGGGAGRRAAIQNTLPWLNHCLRDIVDRDTIGDQRIFVPPGILPAGDAWQPVRA